jgi:hypothetical protein
MEKILYKNRVEAARALHKDRAEAVRSLHKNDAEAARALYKYRSRSLDGLKRVYTIILSVSIGKFLEYIFFNVKIIFSSPHHTLHNNLVTAQHNLFIQLTLFTILITTVSVFFFQEDKLLDIGFGLDPNDEKALQNDKGKSRGRVKLPKFQIQKWHPATLATHCMSVILLLIPFVYLTFSSENSIIEDSGIRAFFLSYVYLITMSAVLPFINYQICKKRLPRGSRDRRRGRHLMMNWLIINSGTSFFSPNFIYCIPTIIEI